MGSVVSYIRNIRPLGPIFSSELQQMSRRRRSYMLRVGYLGLLLCILAMGAVSMNTSYAYETQSVVMHAERQATLGRTFFVTFAIFSVTAMHLIGPVLSSTAIGSERLRRTLDVLLMTPITAWQIVSGKLFSRLLGALILIGLTLPVLAVVRLLGGVELYDMLGLTALAAATALGSTAMGLWLSSHVNRAWAVILLSYLLQAAIYVVIPAIVWMFVALNVTSSGIQPSRNFFEFGMLLMSASNPMWTTIVRVAPTGMSQLASWWPAVAGQVLLTIILISLAARAVRKLPKETPLTLPTYTDPLTAAPRIMQPVAPALISDDSSTAVAGLTHTPTHQPHAFRAMTDNPIRWREMQQPMLPKSWQRRLATYVTLGLLGLTYLGLWGLGGLDEPELHIGYMFCFQTLLLLMAVVFSATCITSEKESDTWTLIIASPLSGRQIIYGKFFGVLRRMKWPMILTASHLLIFTVGTVVNVVATVLTLLVIVTFTLPWVMLGIYFSLACRRVTTAVVLNLLAPLGAFAAVPLVLSFIDNLQRGITRHSFNLAEITLLYLPYYWINVAIERLSGKYRSYDSTVRMPVIDVRVDLFGFIACCVVMCGVAVIITYIGLQLLSRRFNRIVGRADG
jgi:ABC-type transport system involved in multi-copper enzyme maturation permease subunit